MEHSTERCACEGKKCIGCQEVKCIGQFGRRTSKRSGADLANLKSYCRRCDGKRGGERIRQRRRENAKKWNEAHPEEMRQHRSNWRTKNPEKNKMTPEQSRKARLRFKENNPEGYKRKEQIHSARRRLALHTAGERFTDQEWEALKAQYHYTCLACGKQEPDIELTSDHVIPLSKDGKNGIENVQPLCRSCNSSKGAKTIDYRPRSANIDVGGEVQ